MAGVAGKKPFLPFQK